MKKTISLVAALAVAATLALTACSSDDKATFDASEGGQQSSQSTEGSEGSTGSASGSAEAVEPAKAQTIEVNETKTSSTERAAVTLTVHKVVINDYYVETEVTLINDGAGEVNAWFPSDFSGPQLFDDQGLKYLFQGQASGKQLVLQGGEGVNAVLVHAGRVGPQARTLTLDFTAINPRNKELWSQMTFDIPVGSK
ncbi:hypothetical protein GCM10023153_21120 [Ornithinibacter aureus]|uniref:DUF4352 domain-containing protein n=1 Tax=Ornithinibacter aureus TaxID=622664 RepID=A0ABP8JWV5_9MICO|nr:hypothetical protein [Ornithinibacter aureus]KAF0834556.1 hypothetical protein C8E84_2388 [Ornithinibacter aureus]